MPMTLAELLALLPDNSVGAIGADDMRTVTTELYNQPAPGVSAGGTAGQVLTKDTATDYDTSWQTPTGGGGGGAPTGPAGGSLAGTYPNPTIAAGVVGTSQLNFDPATQTELNTEITNRTNADALLIPLSQKGAASGVLALDGTAHAAPAQLGTGTADTTTFLRGDGSWTAPAAAGDVAVDGNDTTVDSSVPGEFSVDLNDNITVHTAVIGPGSPVVTGVRLATIAALPACTYAQPGGATNGTGATLTGNANGALADIDYVTPAAGDRVCVADQASPVQNGLYTITQLGTAGTPFILTRLVEADSTADLQNGMLIAVAEGTVWAGGTQIMSAADITFGTTNIGFDAKRVVESPSDALFGARRDRGRYTTHFEEQQTAITVDRDRIPGTPFSIFLAGTGATATQAGSSVARGVLDLSTGTTATGYCGVAPATGTGLVKPSLFSVNARFRAGYRLTVPVLSDGTNTFTLRVGASTTMISGTAPVSGIYFESAGTANWIATIRFVGVSSTQDTGIAVAVGYRSLAIDYNPVTKTATFYIGTAKVATLSGANLPADNLYSGAQIVKTAGTTARSLQLDLMAIDEAANVIVPILTP